MSHAAIPASCLTCKHSKPLDTGPDASRREVGCLVQEPSDVVVVDLPGEFLCDRHEEKAKQ